MRILLVEDDLPIAEGLRHALRREGYSVDVAHDGLVAREALRQEAAPYEAIILDLGLPRLDGLTLLREWRGRGVTTPVIILTARDESGDRIQGLDSGADDYVAKPFDVNELLARLRAVTRRSAGGAVNELTLGGLRMDRTARRVYAGDEEMGLSPREYNLLELLLTRAGKVVSKPQIQEHLSDWDTDLSDSAIDLYMHRLRKRLEGTGVQLRTIRGFGVMLQAGAADV
ncbi:MAG TPA: response regulator transcription factor [Fluviicoccus sp.]|nr:response regulator transcription factor [Fluviicoccus sp.]